MSPWPGSPIFRLPFCHLSYDCEILEALPFLVLVGRNSYNVWGAKVTKEPATWCPGQQIATTQTFFELTWRLSALITTHCLETNSPWYKSQHYHLHFFCSKTRILLLHRLHWIIYWRRDRDLYFENSIRMARCQRQGECVAKEIVYNEMRVPDHRAFRWKVQGVNLFCPCTCCCCWWWSSWIQGGTEKGTGFAFNWDVLYV